MKKPPAAAHRKAARGPLRAVVVHHKHPAHAHAKAAKSAKHHAAAKKATAAKTHKPRQWSPDEAVAICSLRAVDFALGLRFSDDELLDVYWSLTGDPDEGITIAAALNGLVERGRGNTHHAGALILGVDWPQPHAVVDVGGVWWSWGELWEPWTDAVSEVWPVCAG